MTAVESSARPASSPSPQRRSGRRARRFGYLVAVAVNALLLYLVHVRPGWEAVPFLTDDTRLVLGAVNASIVAGLLANLLYLVTDPQRLRAVGDAVTTAVGLYAMVRIWQVFPFDVSEGWGAVLRVLLGLGIAGSAIGVVAALARSAARR